MLVKLGLLSSWQWAANGKHHTVKDYFRIGSNSPLLAAFSRWMDSGYQHYIAGAKNQITEFHSWRFWAKSPDKDRLICGVIKDSADLIRRPYPFLVIGHGKLSKWEKNWELLPHACEPLWLKAEQIHSRQFDSLKLMADFLNELKPPEPNWSAWKKDLPALNPSRVQNHKMDDLKSRASLLLDLNEALSGEDDLFLKAAQWHDIIKTQLGTIPNAVFIGGVASNPLMAVYFRPLAQEDFKSLWFYQQMNDAGRAETM